MVSLTRQEDRNWKWSWPAVVDGSRVSFTVAGPRRFRRTASDARRRTRRPPGHVPKRACSDYTHCPGREEVATRPDLAPGGRERRFVRYRAQRRQKSEIRI